MIKSYDEGIRRCANPRALLLASLGVLFLILPSCRTAGYPIADDGSSAVRLAGVSLLSGVSAGGIVENSKTPDIEGAGPPDSITGATKAGYNAGIHGEWKWRNHHMATGVDYLGFAQTVDYRLPSFGEEGRRDIRFDQVRIPVTYNLHLLKNRDGNPGIVIKAGVSGGYTFHTSIEDNGSLGEYQFSRWDIGPTVGMTVYPFPAWDAYRMGLYLDFYRGSRIFEDAYHEGEGLGGQSFMKVGVILNAVQAALGKASGGIK